MNITAISANHMMLTVQHNIFLACRKVAVISYISQQLKQYSEKELKVFSVYSNLTKSS